MKFTIEYWERYKMKCVVYAADEEMVKETFEALVDTSEALDTMELVESGYDIIEKE